MSTSSSGPRLISLLLAVDRDREALARAIVDVLHEAGRLKQGKHEAISNKAAALPDKLSWSGSAGSAEGQQGTAASQTLEEPISSLELLCLAPRCCSSIAAVCLIPRTSQLSNLVWHRGKFTVGFGPTQLQVSNNKTSLQTPYAAITAVAVSPGSRSCAYALQLQPSTPKWRAWCRSLTTSPRIQRGRCWCTCTWLQTRQSNTAVPCSRPLSSRWHPDLDLLSAKSSVPLSLMPCCMSSYND